MLSNTKEESVTAQSERQEWDDRGGSQDDGAESAAKKSFQPGPSTRYRQPILHEGKTLAENEGNRKDAILLIDTQNLFMSSRYKHNGHPNYPALLEEVGNSYRVCSAVAYTIDTQEGRERPFQDALRHMGFTVATKPLQVYKGSGGYEHKKGDWDVGIAVDAIRLAQKYQASTVVLASGDGDFIPLVGYLQSMGIRVEVMAFGRTTNKELIRVADKFTDLSDDLNRFMRQKVNND